MQTYSGPTMQPITHFGHLRLNVFRSQRLDSSLGRRRIFEIDETISYKTTEHKSN